VTDGAPAGTSRTIVTAPGVELYTQIWRPAGAPRFVVAILHGQGEYVGRYAELAADFARVGGLCFGADHRGQGRSSGPMGHVDRFEDYAADALVVMRTIAAELAPEQQPGVLPWFLFGHSMGALIGLVYLLDHEPDLPLRAAIFSSPLIEPIVRGAAVKALLGKVLVRVAPTLPIPINVDRRLLFRDPARLEAYLKDRTGYDPLTPGFGEAFAAATRRVRAELSRIRLPMLWYVGTGDRIVAPEPTIRLFRSVPGTTARDQHLEVFEGYYHELHNEAPALRGPVIERVLAFVREHLT
jgi:alpha-beta hydrolase superfamily lysophospholipase